AGDGPGGRADSRPPGYRNAAGVRGRQHPHRRRPQRAQAPAGGQGARGRRPADQVQRQARQLWLRLRRLQLLLLRLAGRAQEAGAGAVTEGVGQALEQALAFWRAPALLAGARQRPLPDAVLDVVRIAAGDRGLAETAAAALGAPPDELAEAAPFYLRQLLFTPDADSYRVLGVNHDASDARIKEHYRWLVRWLHPDRNADEWEALYADRVNR